jgi:hypothetical protein
MGGGGADDGNGGGEGIVAASPPGSSGTSADEAGAMKSEDPLSDGSDTMARAGAAGTGVGREERTGRGLDAGLKLGALGALGFRASRATARLALRGVGRGGTLDGRGGTMVRRGALERRAEFGELEERGALGSEKPGAGGAPKPGGGGGGARRLTWGPRSSSIAAAVPAATFARISVLSRHSWGLHAAPV